MVSQMTTAADLAVPLTSAPLADGRAPTRQAQINVRIDWSLKHAGDEVLAAAGLSPTQAIRRLWEVAAGFRTDPQRLRTLLFPDESSATDSERAERARRQEVARNGAHAVEDGLAALGITLANTTPLSDDELREQGYIERMEERGLL